jgi:predicted metalloprotease with PDZ domain
MRNRRSCPILLFVFIFSFQLFAKNPPGPITISVDASDARRNIFRSTMIIPAAPGPLTLFYPQWIPGEHEPSGPIEDIAGLKFTAAGKTLDWHRDLVNMYAFHLEVPPGANQVEVSLDYLSSASEQGFSSTANATEKLMVVNWNQVLLYPDGYSPRELTYAAKLKLPPGWKYGTALEKANENAGVIEFRPVALNQLVDSPVIGGEYFKVVNLAPDVTPPHRIDMAADSGAALAITMSELDGYNQMVRETGALFGARHYHRYDFLFSMSDHVAHFGLEHHQSSDNRTRERVLIDGYFSASGAGLLTHEFVHSWNGKFRRPADLSTPDYQQPMKDDLLWVYEGLTEYLGEILAARSGLYTPDEFRQHLAMSAADMQSHVGRDWRPLIDTAVSSPVLLENRDQRWIAWKRSADYYEESELIWLEADTIIRRLSNNRRSLDDFCHLFYGGPNNGPELKTYTFEDVVNALNQVAAYDWRAFFTDRVYKIQPKIPAAGIENSGWTLAFDDVPGYVFQGYEQTRHEVDVRYSIGLRIDTYTNQVVDVVPGFAAFQAGLGPGMTVIAVNGRQFTPAALHTAITEAKGGSTPISIQARNGEFVHNYRLDYHEGEKYPALHRESNRPDVLSDIIRSHAKQPARAAK